MNDFNYELYSTYLKTKPLNSKIWNLISDLEVYAGKPKEYYLSLLTTGKESVRSLEALRNIKREQINPFLKTFTTNEVRENLGLNPL